ncbi:MAG: Pribosyltran domain-containing protein [Succiniclasticum sp.]|jgi:ComF family protein
MEDVLFPRDCYACGAEIETGLLCPACRRYLLELKEWGSREDSKGWFFFTYDESIKEVMRRIKFERNGTLLDQCAEELEIVWRSGAVRPKLEQDLGVPLHDLVWCGVPTDVQRRRERGYDLPTSLFRGLAVLSGGIWQPLLCRTRHTAPMYGLGPEERRRNLEDSMALLTSVDGKNIVLTDDIFTTGATFAAASAVLLEGGAASVRCLAFAGSVENLR